MSESSKPSSYELLKNKWKALVLKWQISGLPVIKWCQQNQISYTTFYRWKKRYANQASNNKTPFIELVDDNSCASGVEINFGKFQVVLTKNFDPSTLKKCIGALKEL